MKKLLTISIATLSIIVLFGNANAEQFEDVHTMHMNKDAIEYLETNKVVEGYSDGSFKPENRINRAEFTKILVGSIVDKPTGSNCFPDVKNEWFAPYICTAKKLGYIEGYPDGTFKPGNFINFAEASKIITKANKVTPDNSGTKGEWFAGYVNSLGKKKAIPTTVQFFDKDITRGEMSEVIWRLKEDKTDKQSQDYDSITQDFPALKSCGALKEKFDIYQSHNYYPYTRGMGAFFAVEESMDAVAMPMMAKSMAGEAAAPASAGSVSADDFSTTNIQVEGVDEADIIKNDGKYIYLIKNDVVKIVEAYPPAVMKELGELDFDEDNFRPTEMYINEDQLVVIGQGWNYYDHYDDAVPLIYPPRKWWRGSETVVYIIDITDRKNPKEERVVRFDGSYNTSRRIGNDMYMVLNTSPNVWHMDGISKGDELLPYFKDGDNDAEKMVGCSDIHYFPGFVRPNYLITVSIPLDDADGDIDRDVFLGSSDNVYASQKNMYVTTNQVSYDYYTDWDWNRDRARTLVFKFALEDGNVDFKSRGSVPGRILNQFSMDEHSDHFRIATNIGWGDNSTNNVFVLDKDMKKVGEITDIAPGEKIYSTRFLGDRLYMVTFEQVDPLFVIDLATPSNPKILGKLKIPGFSNYLHPFDENHIIGFGKDTDVNKYGNVLMQGFKMALFDVSDVKNPKQKFAENIGDRGTDSELLRNHKALLFDKDKELLAFPIRIQEKITPAELECSKYRYSECPSLCQSRCIPSTCTTDSEGRAMCTDDCDGLGSCITPEYDRYQTTFSGAVVYTLNSTNGFKERGRVTHYDEEEELKMGEYWPYNHNANIQRMIYIGDFLYSISQSKIKSNTMSDVKFVSSIDLD